MKKKNVSASTAHSCIHSKLHKVLQTLLSEENNTIMFLRHQSPHSCTFGRKNKLRVPKKVTC